MTDVTCPGVILAGGAARRMGGGDKGLRALGGRSVLSHVAARLGPQVSLLALNANGDPARFAALGLPVLPDELEDAGPLAGVLAAMGWAAGLGADRVLTAPSDTPFLPGDLARRLGAAGPAAIAEAGGRVHPACALWPVSAAETLRRRLSDGLRRVGSFAAEIGAVRVAFPDPEAFFNINTPEDLARAERLL